MRKTSCRHRQVKPAAASPTAQSEAPAPLGARDIRRPGHDRRPLAVTGSRPVLSALTVRSLSHGEGVPRTEKFLRHRAGLRRHGVVELDVHLTVSEDSGELCGLELLL